MASSVVSSASSIPSAARLYNNALLSDVTIKQISHNGSVREYHGHKVVLIASGFFYKAFTGNFKEASDNVIELRDDDADHFEFMLKYIYTNQYDTDALEKLAADQSDRTITTPMGIYVIADKYDIPKLREESLKNVQDLLTGRQYSKHTGSLLPAAARLHYGSEAGRSINIGNVIATALLNRHQDFTDTDDFDALVQSCPQFSVDLVMALKRSGRFNVHEVTCALFNCRFVQTVAAKKLQKLGNTNSFCQKCDEYYSLKEVQNN